jgi:hypothetical protein
MKIAFFTEGGYFGKVPRNNPNMRTDQAWICALDAVHIPIFSESFPNENFDVGIVIIPKEKNREYLAQNKFPLIQAIKQICSKVYVMQESTSWEWQDDSSNSMVWYFEQLNLADKILCHNDMDVLYYLGLTNKHTDDVRVLPTLMIDDIVKVSDHKEESVFVAGNWHTGYCGFDAMVVAKSISVPMVGFKSGKFKNGEEQSGIKYLPWMRWDQFMFELSKFKYGVHMYQPSAGQFPLNCAYLGIPCVGPNDINTQRDLHPMTSVDRGDLIGAIKKLQLLKLNSDFYEECSYIAKKLYEDDYSEKLFVKKINYL